MTSVRAENFFPQYLGINISFSHLYRISKTNSCHKCATALKPAKRKKKDMLSIELEEEKRGGKEGKVEEGKREGEEGGKGRGGKGVEEEEEGEVEERKREEEEEEGVQG